LFFRRWVIPSVKNDGAPSSGSGFQQNANKSKDPRINEQIRAHEIRLIGDDGEQFGVVTMAQARLIADSKGLDLVEVSPNAAPPVVKLIDFGKFKYQQQKKAAEAKKKQATSELKEIKFRPSIEQHDLEVKLKKIYKFLDQGDKVKLLLQFRGREMAHKELGVDRFNQIIDMIVDETQALVESRPKLMGNRITAMLAPTKKAK
jgi:translation initiation factor IF-3